MAMKNIVKKDRYIDAYISSLSNQTLLNCTIRLNNIQRKGSIEFRHEKGVKSIFILNSENVSFKKGESVSLSCFSGNIQLTFKSKIARIIENRIMINRPDEIIVSQQRKSERCIIDSFEDIYLSIPSLKKTWSILDIGISGVAIVSDTQCITIGQAFPQCTIHIKELNFTVDCFFRCCVKLDNKQWKYGIELKFTDKLSYLNYIEWFYHLLHPDIYTPAQISSDDLKVCYENTRSVLIMNNATRIDGINNELKSWGEQNRIGPLQCNIAYIKNKKLISACTTRRVYNTTFVTQRLVCIPGIHLNDAPKLSLYSALSEILYHHPDCHYSILYKDRDIEWHKRLFKELATFSQDPQNVYFDKLNYIDVSIKKSYIRSDSKKKKSYSCSLLREPEEFREYISRNENDLIVNAYNYYEISHDTDLISQLLQNSNHSMERRIYKIKKENILIGYAVCEVYSNGYFINNSLDMCRLYLCAEVKNYSTLLNQIIYELSLFYSGYNKNRFRIVWKKQKGKSGDVFVNGSFFKGTLLRLILTKKGLLLLKQITKISKGQFTKYYHLTYPQQSIWHYEQIYPGTTINTIFCTITINDNIDFTLLAKAIKHTIQKNDSTRIQISKMSDKPCQYINPSSNISIPFIDFTQENTKDNFTVFREKLKQKPFTLNNSRLFEFTMFKNNNNSQCGYFIKAHHIIADAWTVGLIVNRIKETYFLIKKNAAIQRKKSPSYINFLQNELEYRFSNKIGMHKEFWLDFIKDTNITSTCYSPIGKNCNGASKRKSFIIEGEYVKRILNYIKNNSCTPFSFFISCFYVYLYKLTDNNINVIGTSVLNRSGPQDRATTGLFASAQPLKVIIDNNSSFIKLTKYVSLTMRKLLKNQKYSSELLLKSLRKGELQNNNLYDITFTFVNFIHNSDFSVTWHPSNHQYESLNVHVNDWEGKGAFNIDYDFHINKYSEKDICRMHSFIIEIMQFVIKHPDAAIKTISMIPSKEADLILNTFNKTSHPYPKEKTVHQLFEEQVEKKPHQIAVIDNKCSLTYDQLNRKANKLARLLHFINKKFANQFIGILIENSSLQIFAQFGILKSGNAYVPFDTKSPKLRIKSIIDDAKITTLVTISKYKSIASALQWECPSLLNIIFLDTSVTNIPEDSYKQQMMNIDLWRNVGKQAGDSIKVGEFKKIYPIEPFSNLKLEENSNNYLQELKGQYGLNIIDSFNDTNIDHKQPSSDLAYAIYTSGTTGKPKGVMISHRSLINLCFWHNRKFNVTQDDIATRYASFSFDASVWELFPFLIIGASVCIIPEDIKLSFKLINKFYREKNITISYLPTKLCEKFSSLSNSSLRILHTGGDKLTKLNNTKYKIVNNYGPTETTVVSISYTIKNYSADIPIGKPIANTKVYILDNNNNLMPIGLPGELCISGDGLARGYINNVDSNKFVENPFAPGTRMYRSGDRARWLPDGNIEFIGRMDDQVKLRGFRIELKEIETVLLQHDAIESAAVILKETAKRDYFLCAYYESQYKINDDILINFLSQTLPHYMIPTVFIFMNSLPLLTSGKIDRKTLKELNTTLVDDIKVESTPHTQTEQIVAEVWGKVLERKNINTSENFFMIGGDSLNVIEVCSIFSEKNIPISVQNLYDFPTVSSLATHIDGHILDKRDLSSIIITNKKNRESVNDIKIGTLKRKFKNVLLTGSTGYLGAHLLQQILLRTNAHIFCLIRGDDKESIKKKFNDNYCFYFKNKDMESLYRRISFLKGDVSITNLSLESDEYERVVNKVDTVFHCAALVKSKGIYEDIKKINYDGLISMANFAKMANAHLCYISTMGISGGLDIKQTKPNTLFTENDLYIGQQYKDNPYTRSKFEAENYLLKEINDGMDATIFRLGLITERWKDGIFQKNVTDNFFHTILKALCTVVDIPGNILEYKIDMSPVDICSELILKLAEVRECSGRIFHVYNPHRITFGELFKLLQENNIKVNILPKLKHNDYIQYLRKNRSEFKSEINKLTVDFDFDKMLDENYACQWNADITQRYLKLLGFEWPVINKEYIGKMIQYLQQIKFLNS